MRIQQIFTVGRLRSRRGLTASLAVATALALIIPSAFAAVDPAETVTHVEEDWELVVDEPSGVKDSPQLATVMSPFSDLDSLFGIVTWNYRELPSFTAGGMQLQSWAGEEFLLSKDFRSSELSTVGETITWTQSLKVNGGVLKLKVQDGHSTTWGAFGGSEMTLSEIINIGNLDYYSADTSAKNSGISYGANRVILLRVKEVRRYNADGDLISTDSTPRVVHQRVDAD